jgi:very-short-patch-repair endonuclease
MVVIRRLQRPIQGQSRVVDNRESTVAMAESVDMATFPPSMIAQCGVFSAAQAASEGWTRSALRWAVRTGRLALLRRGVYQVTDMSDVNPYERERWLHAAPAIAAAMTTPGAFASHSTAAVLHRLPLAFVPRRACVTVVPWHTGEIARTHVHRATSQPLSLPVGAVPCLAVARTVIDLAREHGVPAGVVPLDYALHRNLITPDEVQATLDHCIRWPGVRAARDAVAAADGRSESPLESLSRLKMSQFAIPQPEPQQVIGDLNGVPIARVDFYWHQCGVVGEADGLMKYDEDEDSDQQSLRKEKLRQESLERLGLIVVRWGNADLPDFESVATRLQNAFRRGAARPAADRRWTLLPPTLTPQWS